MKLKKCGQEVSSILTPWNEIAWKIEDVEIVLKHYKETGVIVLGGDILTDSLSHTYDSWYYDTGNSMDIKYSLEESISEAERYISAYVNKNGNNYYVVIVPNDVL